MSPGPTLPLALSLAMALMKRTNQRNIGWGHRISLTIGFKWRPGGPPKSLRAAALIWHHSFKATKRNFLALGGLRGCCESPSGDKFRAALLEKIIEAETIASESEAGSAGDTPALRKTEFQVELRHRLRADPSNEVRRELSSAKPCSNNWIRCWRSDAYRTQSGRGPQGQSEGTGDA